MGIAFLLYVVLPALTIALLPRVARFLKRAVLLFLKLREEERRKARVIRLTPRS